MMSSLSTEKWEICCKSGSNGTFPDGFITTCVNNNNNIGNKKRTKKKEEN